MRGFLQRWIIFLQLDDDHDGIIEKLAKLMMRRGGWVRVPGDWSCHLSSWLYIILFNRILSHIYIYLQKVEEQIDLCVHVWICICVSYLAEYEVHDEEDKYEMKDGKEDELIFNALCHI